MSWAPFNHSDPFQVCSSFSSWFLTFTAVFIACTFSWCRFFFFFAFFFSFFFSIFFLYWFLMVSIASSSSTLLSNSETLRLRRDSLWIRHEDIKWRAEPQHQQVFLGFFFFYLYFERSYPLIVISGFLFRQMNLSKFAFLSESLNFSLSFGFLVGSSCLISSI